MIVEVLDAVGFVILVLVLDLFLEARFRVLFEEVWILLIVQILLVSVRALIPTAGYYMQNFQKLSSNDHLDFLLFRCSPRTTPLTSMKRQASRL